MRKNQDFDIEKLSARNRELEARCSSLQDAVKMQGHFADIAQMLSSALDLPALASSIIDKLIQTTGIKGGAVYLKNEGAFSLLKAKGVETGLLPFEGGIVGEAIAAKDMVIKEGDECSGFTLNNGAAPVMLAAFPCLYEGDVNSVIVVADEASTSFEILSFISAITPNIALSVNNALSYERIRRATRALDNEKNKLHAVITNMTDGLIVSSADKLIMLSNPAVERMFRLAPGSAVGSKVKDVFLEMDIDSMIDEVIKGGGVDIVQRDFKLADRVVRGNAYAISNEGEFLGILTVLRDITKEWEVDRMKTEFISTVSHELRTPLTSVLGFAKLIKKKFDDVISPLVRSDDKKALKAVRQIGDNLSIIVSEGERLTSLINDVLDIAKMEAGKVEWKKELISAEEIIERAATATSSLFDQKGLVMVKDFAPDLPMFEGDRDRLIQVVINLISNAVKFTEAGTVTCGARRQDGHIIVSVRDSGVGIAEEDLPKVFEKFKQVGDTLTDKPTGTGLGLPICTEIVEHHGGRIWAESLPGEGSTFSFTLPAMLNETHATPPSIERLLKHFEDSLPVEASDYTGGKKCVLVVDDESNIRKFLRQVLEENGYDVTEAKDGIEAIAQVRKKKPDIITLDIMMPGISGFDVAAVLKNNPETMEIPIIILSVIEDEERGYRLGIDKYLTKPIDTAVLLKSIESLLSRGGSKKKVLVIDEDESTVRTLKDVLEARGYQIAEAYTGEEGIKKAVSMRPDMVIVDSGLSDRYDIVRILRSGKNLDHILFIVLSETGSSEKIETAKKRLGLRD
jgi:PAS domain S-box-containing protein